MAEAELGRFIDRFTVEYVRVFPHPIERVWRAITEPDELRVWFMPAVIEPENDGAFHFGGPEQWVGAVVAFEPPHLLRLQSRGQEPGYFQYELSEVPSGTQMRFVQRFPSDGDYPFKGDGSPGDGTPWPGAVSGWHEFWDALGAHLDGVPADSLLAPTEMHRIVTAWVREAERTEELSPRMAASIRIGLRRKERWAELNRLYDDHMRRTLPADPADAGLGRFIDRYTMEYVRRYPHPVARVWQAITDPDQLAIWFMAPTKWRLEVGGAYRFHDDDFAGKIEALEAPVLARFGNASDDGGYFQFELSEVPEGTEMRFTFHFSPEGTYVETPGDLGGDLPGGPGSPWKPGTTSGWHEFWDGLGEFLDGVPVGSRLPPTDMSRLVSAWVEGVQQSYGLPTAVGTRVCTGLRRQERWNELNKIYRRHIAETIPPS